ncbi:MULTISPECIES: hypothetical protein [Nostocaceae]|uniref:hypothetical protein n=1 Tax=Nostocaceae TaxID=1162 RepID=UPI001689F34A|nr:MULTISPECIES: hypothetical protein [Nostocaceae]MBD2300863.1 hypothetical protein [Nostoc sp. FACHB-190]MBD2477878.1 hypothetical protein [Anabaena sp. FACHB-83]
MQVAPRLLLTETLRERSATRSRVTEEAISISNFVKWYYTHSFQSRHWLMLNLVKNLTDGRSFTESTSLKSVMQ